MKILMAQCINLKLNIYALISWIILKSAEYKFFMQEPVSHVDQIILDLALVAPVIAVASPSAVR